MVGSTRKHVALIYQHRTLPWVFDEAAARLNGIKTARTGVTPSAERHRFGGSASHVGSCVGRFGGGITHASGNLDPLTLV